MQTYEDYEVIITDDSPDTSVEEVISALNLSHKFSYYRNKEKKGSPENWNEAVRRASGEYIKILHHDDWFSGKESLATYVKLLDDNAGADFACSSTTVCSVKSATARVHSTTTQQLEQLRKNPTDLFYGNVIGAPSATLYRNTVNLEYDGNLQWLVDVDFYIRLLKKNSMVAYCHEPLICTTDEAPHQVTNQCHENKNLMLFEYIRLYQKFFDSYKYDARQFKFFLRLFKMFDVCSLNEIYEAGVSHPVPKVILHVIKLRKALKWLKSRVTHES